MGEVRRALTEDERLDWLRLIRSENVGPIGFRQLVRRFGAARAAVDALPELARRGGRGQPLRIHPRDAAQRELEALRQAGARLVASIEPDYPEALHAIADAPPLLAVRGDLALLSRPAVAIVGARNASGNGRRLAEELARGLGSAGLIVVSGMARGIDAAAHGGALPTGTLAVLAGGVDVIYPPENAALYERIVGEGGAVVAEQPAGTEPQARHFPRRNRLISGLSLGVIVVEAALRSGSLITVRFALEQGREVFSVPGSPLDPRCRGSNNLLRQGAILTETAEDVIEALRGTRSNGLAEQGINDLEVLPGLAPADSQLRHAHLEVETRLGPSPVAVDELVRQCQLSAAVVQTVLLDLELAGRLERQPGNRVCLVLSGATSGS